MNTRLRPAVLQETRADPKQRAPTAIETPLQLRCFVRFILVGILFLQAVRHAA
jgi:hypothetical protein